VAVTWAAAEGLRFVASARQHRVVIDRSSEGREEGLRSGELLLMALGVCTAATVMNHASVRAMPIRGLTVAVESEKLSAPSRYGRIQVSLTVDGDVSEAERALIMRVAHACTVHNTLCHPPEIVVAWAAGSGDPAPGEPGPHGPDKGRR
jgi:putative redox protein